LRRFGSTKELLAHNGWDVMGTAGGLSPLLRGAAGDGPCMSFLHGSEETTQSHRQPALAPHACSYLFSYFVLALSSGND